MEDALSLLEQKYASLEKQYQTVVDALYPNFIFVFDENFHFVDVITPAGLRLFHRKEELIGVDGRKFYTPQVSKLFLDTIQDCLTNNNWREIEYHLDVGDTRNYYQARIVPIEGNRVMCMIQDIGNRVRRMEELMTQRKRTEEANRHKSAFLANISHEIRTPLNAIVSFSEFLMGEERPDKRQDYMDIIRTSNSMVLQIVDDVLDLSRLESGMSEFRFEDVDVAALIKKTVEIYQPQMKPQVRLIVDMPDTVVKAPTDANRVKQVLFNFLTNAIKYTEQGSITLKVEEGDDFLKFMVIDTGCGIPESQIGLIFNRFEKIGRQVTGTGLGLAICKSIAGQLGGDVGVSSKEGVGSEFWFKIPYRHVAYDMQKAEIARESVDVSKRKKIMIVETCHENLKQIKSKLTENFEIVEVTDSEKIFSTFILDHPALILLCIDAAYRKNDVIAKIRAISPTLPIIAMATSDFYNDQRWAIENGCNDVIARPFSRSKINEVIMAFLV